jgi:PAS domain S-box-containing protein
MTNAPQSAEEDLLDLALREVSTLALILLDPKGVIVRWLAGAERLFGYKAEEIIGKNVCMLFTPEDVKRELSAWELNTARDSGESEDDRWQVRKDGGRIWVSGTLTALRDSRGALVGFAKVIRNRTDQKFQFETLESRIAGFHGAEKRKNDFIATLAHELRNPLNAINSACALLAEYDTSPDKEMALGTIRRQVEFIDRMLRELLDGARAATGKVSLKKERVAVQDIVSQAIEVCRPKIEQQTHELLPLMPDIPIMLDADPLRLRQVFVNLLENAVKYTRHGGTIWVKATTEGNEAVVRVQDTGIGISPDVMPHIFDLFTQGEIALPAEGGLGIGLSVVKEIVGLHGGTVQATSDGLGKGSEFTVRLPLPHPPSMTNG